MIDWWIVIAAQTPEERDAPTATARPQCWQIDTCPPDQVLTIEVWDQS